MKNPTFETAKRIASLKIYLQDWANGMDFSVAISAHKARMNNERRGYAVGGSIAKLSGQEDFAPSAAHQQEAA